MVVVSLVASFPNPKLIRPVGSEPRIVPGVKPWTYGNVCRTCRV